MKNNKKSLTVSQRMEYHGPIPPAAELIRYNEACPTAAERIIAMAEKQAEHRQQCEKKSVQHEFIIALTSVIFSLFLGLVLCSLIFYAIYKEQFSTALATVILAIGSVIGIYFGKKIKKE